MPTSLLEKLEQKGLGYETLNAAERETFKHWQEALAKKELTLTSVKDFVAKLVEATQRDVTDLKESTSFWSYIFHWKRDVYLKARLKNYLMIQDFLTGPDRAKKYIEQSIENINK